jgi:hypothetical protein
MDRANSYPSDSDATRRRKPRTRTAEISIQVYNASLTGFPVMDDEIDAILLLLGDELTKLLDGPS